jgi:uncharacterized membrane protein YfcA
VADLRDRRRSDRRRDRAVRRRRVVDRDAMLAMLGVPPIMAVASPLPATIPSAAALLVVIALAIPTLIVHWSPGHIDRTVAAAFALGAVPGAFVAGRFAHVVEGPRI